MVRVEAMEASEALTVASMRACFLRWRSRTFSSMVSWAMSLMAWTVFFWPMRWARSVACSSAAVFHLG